MDNQLLLLLKEVSDSTRLQILGLLGQMPRSGDELAALLELKPSTVSHHLTRLQKVGLVRLRTEQYYHVYSLETVVLEQLRSLLTPHYLAEMVRQNDEIDGTAYQQQILARWIENDRLQALPTQIKHRRIVLQWLAEKFEWDQRYALWQVDDLLNRWCSWRDHQRIDIATVTRSLVDHKLLNRTADGGYYWRTDSPLALETSGFTAENLPIANTDALHVSLPVSALRKQVQLEMRIKANQSMTEAEIDGLIERYCPARGKVVSTIRMALLAEGLLVQRENGNYVRLTIAPDHPANVKLRNETLALQQS